MIVPGFCEAMVNHSGHNAHGDISLKLCALCVRCGFSLSGPDS